MLAFYNGSLDVCMTYVFHIIQCLRHVLNKYLKSTLTSIISGPEA